MKVLNFDELKKNESLFIYLAIEKLVLEAKDDDRIKKVL